MSVQFILPTGKTQFFYPNGSPLANGTVGMYLPNTLVTKTTYQDLTGTVPNTNPVTLDANGQAVITGTGTYRQIVKDVNGSTLWDQQVSDGGLTAFAASLIAGTGGTLVGFLQNLVGAIYRTMLDKNRDIVNAKDFGIVADYATDQTAQLVTVLSGLGTGFRRDFVISPGTVFDVATVYAAAPLGTTLLDNNGVSYGQYPGYKNKHHVYYSSDSVSDDAVFMIASNHHATLEINNFGTAGTTSANSRYTDIIFAAGINADKDPITTKQILGSKAPGKTCWRWSIVELTSYLGALSPKWVTNTAAASGVTYCYFGSNYYVAASTGTTGLTAPTWTTGTMSDGGVDWTYVGDYNGGYTLHYIDDDGEMGYSNPFNALVHRYNEPTKEISHTYDLNGDYTIRAVTYGANLLKFTYSLGQLTQTTTMFGGPSSGTALTPVHINTMTFGYGSTWGASTDSARAYSVGVVTSANWALYDRTDASIRIMVAGTGGHFSPGADNTQNCGTASLRWATVYAGTGAINTSDERQKTDIGNISEAVLRAWGNVEYQQFRFIDAVASKGVAARLHVGVLAQKVKSAFEAEGVDPFAYGILCYDKWEGQEEKKAEDGTILAHKLEAGDRYGIRYEEALALECAYLRSQFKKGEGA